MGLWGGGRGTGLNDCCVQERQEINERSPGAGTNPDAAPGASANWRGVILPQTPAGVRGILFK